MSGIADIKLNRRSFVRGSLMLGAAGAAGPLLLSSCSSGGTGGSSGGGGGTINWLTWSDHYANDQLAAVAKQIGIRGRPTLFSDNADAYLKIKRTGSQFDIVSGDALWVPKYHKDGLTESFDLSSLPVKNVSISVSLLTPVEKPHLLTEGKTDGQGLFRGTVVIPPVEGGGAAVLLNATLKEERVELKWLVAGTEEPGE